MDRIKYQIPPLVEVIFQLRFPTILALNTQDPIDFHNRIRSSFPYYSYSTQEVKETRPDGQTRVLRAVRNHQFTAKDKMTKINIESTFIAISSHSYSTWEEFRVVISEIISIFDEYYKPAFYTRVGLRYIDVIERSKWGLQDKKWSELINANVLGFMNENTLTYRMDAESPNSDEKSLTKYHFELAKMAGTNENVFMIDCDYSYGDTVELSDYINIADELHKCSSNFIQSAIKDVLHYAMKPELIG